MDSDELDMFDRIRAANPARAGNAGWLVTLEAYCAARSAWNRAAAHVDEHGLMLVVRDGKGDVKQALENPHQKVLERERRAAIELAGKLGPSTKGLIATRASAKATAPSLPRV